MRGDGNPFMGVPQGKITVENPDGTYVGPRHSLYDTGGQCVPLVPGDYTPVGEMYEAPEAGD